MILIIPAIVRTVVSKEDSTLILTERNGTTDTGRKRTTMNERQKDNATIVLFAIVAFSGLFLVFYAGGLFNG